MNLVRVITRRNSIVYTNVRFSISRCFFPDPAGGCSLLTSVDFIPDRFVNACSKLATFDHLLETGRKRPCRNLERLWASGSSRAYPCPSRARLTEVAFDAIHDGVTAAREYRPSDDGWTFLLLLKIVSRGGRGRLGSRLDLVPLKPFLQASTLRLLDDNLPVA